MESAMGFMSLANFFAQYGPLGLVVAIWYSDIRLMRKMLKEHEDHMKEIRRMYESNVKLVDAYEDLAGDLKEVVIMNTQAMTTLNDSIKQNQFCPMLRVDKEKVEISRRTTLSSTGGN
jgi:F0F1-type ATP synthase gamma subunit